jgi:hypothetical protein
MHAHALGLGGHGGVERGARHAKAWTLGKARMRFDCVVYKLNSVEGGRGKAGEIHAKIAQGHQAVWHDAFAASFVNGRVRGVCKGHTHSALCRCNRYG